MRIKNWQQFNESIDNQYIKNISEDEFLKLIKTTPYHPDNDLIYRKVSSFIKGVKINNYTDFNIVNPQSITRISPHSLTNIYNLLFSNLPSWKEYPTRNKSLICGDLSRASGHWSGVGSVPSLMVVIPLHECNVGICPSHDIWDSFNDNIQNTQIEDIETYTLFFKDVISHYVFDVPNNWNEDWNIFSEVCKEFDEKRKTDKKWKFLINDKALYEKWNKKEISTIEALNHIFNPNNNEFELIKYKKGFKIPSVKWGTGDKECWLDAKSLLIDHKVFNKIKHKI